MHIAYLENWVHEHNIESRSYDAFWTAFYKNNSIVEKIIQEFGQFDIKSFTVELDRISLLVINWPKDTKLYVEVIFTTKYFYQLPKAKRPMGSWRERYFITYTSSGEVYSEKFQPD